VFIPHSLSSKYYKAPLVNLSAAYQFCPKSYWDTRSGGSSPRCSSTACCCTYAVTKVISSSAICTYYNSRERRSLTFDSIPITFQNKW